jgi:two-component system response regulator YesN
LFSGFFGGIKTDFEKKRSSQGIRTERAAKMLEEGYLKVYEISEVVGYTDINYFYRIFRKFKGMSPMEYRKAVRMRKCL